MMMAAELEGVSATERAALRLQQVGQGLLGTAGRVQRLLMGLGTGWGIGDGDSSKRRSGGDSLGNRAARAGLAGVVT
jgi:hypothetical protein